VKIVSLLAVFERHDQKVLPILWLAPYIDDSTINIVVVIIYYYYLGPRGAYQVLLTRNKRHDSRTSSRRTSFGVKR